MEKPTKIFPQRNELLRQQRLNHNWRLHDVADQLGTTITTVQRWERGSQQPSAYYRAKLCALFDTSAKTLGLVEDTIQSVPDESTSAQAALASISIAEETTLWTVPYMRNPHFTGRDDILSHLIEQFFRRGPGQTTTLSQAALTQGQALRGLGGIGKTQIAVEYAYRAREQGRYAHTIWINAASEEAILSSFGRLADYLPSIRAKNETEQRRQITAIIHWLEQHDEPWLLIMDNADDLTLVQPYLPHQGNGHILLTTRTSAVGSLLASSVEVDTMGLIEGTQLLLRRMQRFEQASDDEVNEASNLVVTLGHFPLALDQAGAYIEETGCSINNYLQLYRKHRHALLVRRGKQTIGYPDSVATTWSLSFDHVKQANPAAAELLCLCAFLSPDHIPEELFTEGATYWPPLLQQAVVDEFSFDQLVETLLVFSLVKRLSKDHLLSLHRLVQVVLIERLQPQERHRWAKRVVQAMAFLYPKDPEHDVSSWPRCQRYLEQAQDCDRLIQEYQLLMPEAADVLDRTSTYLRERALYLPAEALLQRGVHMREQLVGPKHPQVATSLNNLATLYQFLGKYNEAETLYKRALHIREHLVGSEHLSMAETQNDLAALYWLQGKYDIAEPLYQQALHIREHLLGPEHPLVATSLNNLAALYCRRGQLTEAEPLWLQAVHIQEQALGPDHPQVAFAINNLAYLYFLQGKYTEAEPRLLYALRTSEQHLGSEHPQLAYILHGLALLYDKQHKYTEAEQLYQRALYIREQALGSQHSETADVLHDFAVFQQEQGKFSEAEHLYQRALGIREQVLGADHALTRDTDEHLSSLLHQQKQAEEIATQETAQQN